MQHFSISPREMVASLWRHRGLILALVRRDVIGRYRGSVMGVLWSFINPLMMLAVYTFVFSVIFKARWNAGEGSRAEFALILFLGLIVFNLFSESFNRAPSLIVSNVNYVKKVVFPLEILPAVAMGASLFHAMISFFVWFCAYWIFYGTPHITIIFAPLILLPLLLFTLGVSWILTSIGVYLRDANQLVAVMTTVLMFLSPIFYPVTALPKAYQGWLMMNPLAPAIEQMREVLFWGRMPDFAAISIYLVCSALIAFLGFAWFQKTRSGFADVL